MTKSKSKSKSEAPLLHVRVDEKIYANCQALLEQLMGVPARSHANVINAAMMLLLRMHAEKTAAAMHTETVVRAAVNRSLQHVAIESMMAILHDTGATDVEAITDSQTGLPAVTWTDHLGSSHLAVVQDRFVIGPNDNPEAERHAHLLRTVPSTPHDEAN